MMNDVSVIVRECGERTAEACVQLLSTVAPRHEIIRVAGHPFGETLRLAYQKGLEKNLPWTVCIDADVLVFPEAIQGLLGEARRAPPNTFELQGLVFDKLFVCWRPAGNHLYRTAFLRQALSLIPDEGSSLRPESDTIAAMARKDGPSIRLRHRVGAYDFEQSSADIYGKGALHARKHDYLLRYLIPLWQGLSGQDNDFRVALEAATAAAGQAGPATVDRHYWCAQPSNDEKARQALTEVSDPERYVLDLLSRLGPAEDEIRSKFQRELDCLVFPTVGRWHRPWQTIRGRLASAVRAMRFARAVCLDGRLRGR